MSRSSSSNGSGRTRRTNVATPMTTPRVRIGTTISDRKPNRRIFASRGLSSTIHGFVAASSTGSSTGLPSVRQRAAGNDGWTTSPVLATDSGHPGSTDCCPARRIRDLPVTGCAGSSPRRTDSSRSTTTKSARRGTATSARSWVIRMTSRLLPIRALASLSRASRCCARQRSVTSTTM